MFNGDKDKEVYISGMSDEEQLKFIHNLGLEKYLSQLNKMSDEEVVKLREKYRKNAGRMEEGYKKFLLYQGINETLAEMIVLEKRDQTYFELKMKSRDGEWYGIKFKLGTKETVLEKYRIILKELETKPTPEECKEYFDTLEIPVEILPSILSKIDDLDY